MADLEGAVVFDTKDLLDYQDNGIVSRVLVKKGKGSVTLMAFDTGEELSEHSAPFDALVQVIDGVGEVAVAGKWQEVKAGQTILLPADIPHAVKAPGRFKMLLTMIRV